MTRVEGPTGIVTEYTYDLIGRVLTEVSPDRGTQRYRYDRADNMVEMTDGRGVISAFSYDRLERLESKTFPNSNTGGNEDVSYNYDSCELGLGRLCSIQDESGGSNYGYDAWGNVVSREFTEVGGTVFNTAYAYDNGNNVSSTTYPSGRVLAFDRDGQRRVSGIQAVVNGSPQFIMRDITYRGDNQMLTCTYGNGLEDQRTYDLQGRLRTQLLTNTSGATVDTRSYGYDRNSNLLSVQTNFENNNYVYDPKDRVQNDIIDAISNTLYDYDLNNNRLTSSVTNSGAAAGSDVYQYNPGSNQISYVESFREETIADIQQANRRMVYNDVGRLFQLYESDELTAEYIYNESGQRIRKTVFAGGVETATTIFHYNLGGLLISETDRDGNLIRDYIWSEAGHPIAQVDSTGGVDNLTYLHQDHLMTNRLGTDENQQVVWRWEGEAFGSTPAIEDAGVVVNLRFPGQYFDQETGWFYNWNRYYDPRIGRYISSDPIGLYGGGNTYGYVAANPNLYYDPMGLKWYPPSIPQGVVDFSAGFGDTLLLGLGDEIRDILGVDGGVNKCSAEYSAGEWTGIATGIVFGGLAGWKMGGVKATGKEFSHWIPNRARKLDLFKNKFGTAVLKKGNKWNGNYVSPKRHFQHDNWRYPRGHRDMGSRFPKPIQQLDRIPNVYKGAGLGGGLTGVSAYNN